jgi:hypothetical protein
MRRFTCAAMLSAVTFAFVLAGATTDRSVVSVLGKPEGVGPCSSVCGVGSEGQGGFAGNAQGGYVIRPSTRFSDTTVRFAGPPDSGLARLSGATEGSVSGHIHDNGDSTGHLTGIEGQCSGHC